MNKRKLWILILVAIIPLVSLFWILRAPREFSSDEAKYREWRRTIRFAGRVMSLERNLPQGVSRFFRLSSLERKYIDKHSALGDSLVASGYLTNVDMALPNPLAQRTSIVNRLTNALPGMNDEWEFSIRSNKTVVLTCRPQHVAVYRRALESE